MKLHEGRFNTKSPSIPGWIAERFLSIYNQPATRKEHILSLLRSAAAGESAAFDELYNRHAGRIYGLLLRILGDAGTAQNALQETFLQAFRNAHLYDSSAGSEGAWLDSIARGAAGGTALDAASPAETIEPVQPPPAVSERIREAVIGPSGEDTIRETTLTQRVVSRPAWWLAAVAFVFLALWGFTELRLIATRGQIDEMGAARHELEESNRRLQHDKDTLNVTLRTLSGPETRTMAMTGQPAAPRASARLFLDPKERRAVIFFHQLPANPADKTYQLWIIRADSKKPHPAGTFNVDERGEGQLSVENLPVGKELKSLTVTLEPREGVPAPTGKIYLALGPKV